MFWLRLLGLWREVMWRYTAKYWSSSYLPRIDLWADLWWCWFIVYLHTTEHRCASFVSHEYVSRAHLGANSECNVKDINSGLCWIALTSNGSNEYFLWTWKAHTSILTMTGLIISCRFACGELYVHSTYQVNDTVSSYFHDWPHWGV